MQSAALKSASQHTIPREFRRQWQMGVSQIPSAYPAIHNVKIRKKNIAI